MQGLASTSRTKITRAVIVTNSMNPSEKVRDGPFWLVSVARHALPLLARLQWVYCPGHDDEKGTAHADTPHSTYGQQLGRAEMLEGLRNFFNKSRPEHHSTGGLEERRKNCLLVACLLA